MKMIKDETAQLADRTTKAFDGMVDKVEIDDMLRGIIGDKETARAASSPKKNLDPDPVAPTNISVNSLLFARLIIGIALLRAQVYDLPPLHATKLVKSVPTANEEWERTAIDSGSCFGGTGVQLYMLLQIISWHVTTSWDDSCDHCLGTLQRAAVLDQQAPLYLQRYHELSKPHRVVSGG